MNLGELSDNVCLECGASPMGHQHYCSRFDERKIRDTTATQANQILSEAIDMMKQLEPEQRALMVVSLIEWLDEPADTTDGFVSAVRSALTERLVVGSW